MVPTARQRVGSAMLIAGLLALLAGAFLPWKAPRSRGIRATTGWDLVHARGWYGSKCGLFFCSQSMFKDSSGVIPTGALPLAVSLLLVGVVILVAGVPWRTESAHVPVLHGQPAFWTGVASVTALSLLALFVTGATGATGPRRYGAWITVSGFWFATIGLALTLVRPPDLNTWDT